MIPRYSRPEMANLWTDKQKFNLWLEIELAVCEAWGKSGRIPSSDLKIIRSKAGYDINRIDNIERTVHHDVIAFLTSVAEYVGPPSRFIHLGLTSSDLVDTAFALQLKKAGGLIEKDIKKLQNALKTRALKFKKTPMIGRSHGIHAEPTTFGLKLAGWFAEFARHLHRLLGAIDGISVGKMSGAVGTFAHVEPKIEEYVCAKLGLKSAPVSTQIIQRDRHAHFFAVLAGIAASIEKIAVEIRHLQRTEVGEAAEPFARGQKGSSAMPHKRNPVLCENLCGLARIVRANASVALENVALWHERDISHSSAERVIAPDSTTLVDFMLTRLKNIIENMDVYPKRMMKNLEMTNGLYNSQEVLLSLVDKGMSREKAYKLVQELAMRSIDEEKSFLDLLLSSKDVKESLPPADLKKLFDINIHFKYIDEIFSRVFLNSETRNSKLE